MAKTLFTGVQVLDCTGAASGLAELRKRGVRILGGDTTVLISLRTVRTLAISII